MIIDRRRNKKQETTRFAVINEFDQGLRFVHNPTKSTKRRPPQNRLEITSKWFERDCDRLSTEAERRNNKICGYQQI